MKRVLSIFMVVVLAMALVFAFGTTALAADVDWSASLSPSSLSSGGTVTFSSSIKNNTGAAITDVVIIYPDGSSHTVAGGSVAAGASESYTDSAFAVTDEQLGTNLSFQLVYYTTDESGTATKHTLTATGVVEKKTGSAKVSGSTSANKTSVDVAGDKVTLTFVFKNSGDAPATECRLYASPINNGNEITQNPFSLEAGATKTLTYTTAVNESVTVSPKLTFKVNGNSSSITTNTIQLTVGDEPDVPVIPETASIGISAVADNPEAVVGDKVEFTITVKNSGTADLTDIAVLDNELNSISMNSSSLSAGATATGKVTYTLEKVPSEYSFSVTAFDSLGEAVTAETASIKVGKEEEEEDIPKGLYIDVAAENDKLEEPGEAVFDILVTNTSDFVLSNVKVTEKTLGEIAVIPELGTDVKTIQHKVNVEQTTQYIFTVEAQLADGTVVSAVTEPITISVESTGPDMLMIIIVIIIIVVVVLVILLLVLRSKKKKKGNGGTPGNENGRSGGSGQRYSGQQRYAEPSSRQSSGYYGENGAQRPMRQRSTDTGSQTRTRYSSNNTQEYRSENRNDMYAQNTSVNRTAGQKQSFDFTVEDEYEQKPSHVTRAEDKDSFVQTDVHERRSLNVESSEPQTRTARRHSDRNNF